MRGLGYQLETLDIDYRLIETAYAQRIVRKLLNCKNHYHHRG
ncbi:hypothetical protein VEx25_A1097 [Vibrio antiquarius]|uniref:Uncharacterized protein n=2 Tax=Vibrio antiquarius (strain Ex25) TaxID=150340 RepID=A0ACA6QS27_VIBAE|nr:hypothetical protein VEA_000545 [Vibrio antiquarius]EDN58669.1 hypothetical protein VEx25_A1097 [Vibrio antiquarius]EMD77360.1 hypothetical protein C408_4231 [Vibrio diabolicus E0666]